MNKLLSPIILAFSALIFSFSSVAETEVEGLSPELRQLFKSEMRALELGMQLILPAYISGDMDKVNEIAKQIQHSYILKQNISPAQQKELKHKLPNEFLTADQQFHEYAGMLAHVAEEKHLELVGFYYYKLIESCLGCHSAYASHRFPELHQKSNISDHH